jgi:chromate transporter
MLGGTIAILAIFTPGLLLVSAALPVWARLKAMPRARGFVRGASAGVVGVLGAALIHPVATSAVLEPGDAFVAAGGYLALMAKAPAWMVIAGVAIAGAGVHAFI